jgi:hypothetical protein
VEIPQVESKKSVPTVETAAPAMANHAATANLAPIDASSIFFVPVAKRSTQSLGRSESVLPRNNMTMEIGEA